MKANIILTIAFFISCCVIGCQQKQRECLCKYEAGTKAYYQEKPIRIGNGYYDPRQKECAYFAEDGKTCLLYYEHDLIPIQ